MCDPGARQAGFQWISITNVFIMRDNSNRVCQLCYTTALLGQHKTAFVVVLTGHSSWFLHADPWTLGDFCLFSEFEECLDIPGHLLHFLAIL